VSYKPSPKDGKKCADCNLFVAPKSCKTVTGEISPDGGCKLWVKKARCKSASDVCRVVSLRIKNIQQHKLSCRGPEPSSPPIKGALDPFTTASPNDCFVHVLKSGGRWIDAPPDYGPRKTLYNRYVRWAEKGVWVALFQTLAQAGGPPEQVLVDSSAVKAHRSASGRKGGDPSLRVPSLQMPTIDVPVDAWPNGFRVAFEIVYLACWHQAL